MGLVDTVSATRAVGRYLFVLQQILLIVVALSLIVSLTPHSDWAYRIGGILAIVCLLEFAATNIYLGFAENKLFFRNGFRVDRFH